MRKIILCGLLSAISLFACVESKEPASEPAPQSEPAAEPTPSDGEASLAGGCCIDYTCPSPDFITTGCKVGAGPTIREAYEECNAACPVTCASSGLYCD
jgi:hypothetical protein